MQQLLDTLQKKRGKGRNDYPIPTLWDELLATLQGEKPTLPAHALSRFTAHLLLHLSHVEGLHQNAVADTPGLGNSVIFDHFPLSFPRPRRSYPLGDEGEMLLFEKSKATRTKWHGYRLHTLLDAKTALPLASSITPASNSNFSILLNLLTKLPYPVSYVIGDATFDNEELITHLWEKHRIKPLFDLMPTTSCKLLTPLSKEKNIVHNDRGEVFCTHPSTRKTLPMIFAGFEEKRACLKYRCVATSYDSPCKGSTRCRAKSGVRIPLSANHRLFTPVARGSYKWQTLSSHNATARYHTHLNQTLLRKLPFIRGPEKLRLFTLLSHLLQFSLPKI